MRPIGGGRRRLCYRQCLPPERLLLDNFVDQDAGEIYFSQEADGNPGNGSGILATITFNGKTPGESAISFDKGWTYLENTDGESIEYDAQDGTTTVTFEYPVYLPLVLRKY
jgi:hypothetical protein